LLDSGFGYNFDASDTGTGTDFAGYPAGPYHAKMKAGYPARYTRRYDRIFDLEIKLKKKKINNHI
jgi:hypothetical protein